MRVSIAEGSRQMMCECNTAAHSLTFLWPHTCVLVPAQSLEISSIFAAQEVGLVHGAEKLTAEQLISPSQSVEEDANSRTNGSSRVE